MRIRWRGLELPSKVKCEQATPTFGRFTCEPFERGFGITVGNSLRRALLSSLEGSAVTKIKLRGAQLEFTSLEGVVEDVTEIVLNVKSLIVRSHNEGPSVIRIVKTGPGEVTGHDVVSDQSHVEIINPDLLIATLTQDVEFELELVVENGRGYVPVGAMTSGRDRNTESGYIPIDASFSPVVKVKYDVQETRVGQKTNYERLNLEITTDGSITPEMALVEAAKILRKHLNPFIQYDRPEGDVFCRLDLSSTLAPALRRELQFCLDTKLALLRQDEVARVKAELSVRASNCLENENITTVGQLVSRNEDDLLDLRNFGETSLNEVKQKLNEIGLRLGMRVPGTQGSQIGKYN